MTQLPLHLSELTYPQAAELEGAVGLLPAGATEAHGPHLPLNTDVIISVTSAEHAARVLRAEGHKAIVMPPLAYAVTEFAADFRGTVSISLDTARALVRDVLVGTKRAGLSAVVICNAHLEPGNLQALREGMKLAQEQGIRAEFPDVTRKPHALRLGDEFKSGACHAGRYETSLVMAANPFLVRRHISEELEPNPQSLSVAIRQGKTSFIEAGGPDAYFGYPAEATEAEGHELYEVLADIYATAARELLSAG